jgi:ABC-2 type transport system ATP-binding protein
MSVQVRDLKFQLSSFSFGPQNFDFSNNGLYLIRGKNGCGKTSLLRCLLGRIRKSGGEVLGLKFPIATCGIESLFIGSWTLQENFDWLTDLGGFNKFLTPPDSSMKSYLNHRFDRLSLGQKRQAELHFVLNLPAPTFFLDEPFTHLDHENILRIASDIQKLAEKKLILMTSHQAVKSLKFSKVIDL